MYRFSLYGITVHDVASYKCQNSKKQVEPECGFNVTCCMVMVLFVLHLVTFCSAKLLILSEEFNIIGTKP